MLGRPAARAETSPSRASTTRSSACCRSRLPLIACLMSVVRTGSSKPVHHTGSGLVSGVMRVPGFASWADGSFQVATLGGLGGVKLGPTVQPATSTRAVVIVAHVAGVARIGQTAPPPPLDLPPVMKSAVGIITKDIIAVSMNTSL